MAASFELVLDHAGKFHFDLRAPEGYVLLSSLACDSKVMVQDEILRARNALRDASRMVTHHNQDGRHFIVIKARNGSVLARSPQVTSEEQLADLADQIRAAAVNAPLVDLTIRRPQSSEH